MTIRLRLALLFSTVTLLLLVGGGYLFLHRLQTGLEGSLDGTLRTRADTVISQIGPLRQAELDGRPIGRIRLSDVNGVFAQFLDASGRVLDSSRGLPQAPLITPAEAAAGARHEVILDATVTLGLTGDRGPESMRILARPTDRPRVVLVVAVSRDVVDEAVHRSTRQLLGLGAIVVLLSVPGWWLLTRAALRPVERMRRQVAALHARDAGAELAVPRNRDEIARLAQTFNGLLDRLHAALSRERAFVADAGHELRTPLTVLKGELELARRPGRSRDDLAATVEVAAEETDRLIRLTEDLLLLAGEAETRRVRFTQFDVTSVVAAAVRAAAPSGVGRGVLIVVAAPTAVRATGDPNRIRQAVDNLLSNAIRHGGAESTVTVSVSTVGDDAQIVVADEGTGFPPAFLPVAFERFTRADDTRSRGTDSGGNGLGLAIVAAIMNTHGGTATAANTATGAEVTLRWPAEPASWTDP